MAKLTIEDRARMGGEALRAKYGDEHFEQLGVKGGGAILKKHGREYFSRLGSIPKRKRRPSCGHIGPKKAVIVDGREVLRCRDLCINRITEAV